jgi:PKD repeat protein
MKRNYYIFSITALLALVLLISGVSAGETINFTLDNVVVNNGGTATMNILMQHHSPTNGTSGFTMTLAVADPTKARISGVTVNSSIGGLWSTMPTFPVNSMTTTWADSGHKIEVGQTVDTVVATVTIEGLAPGSTTLNTKLLDLTGDPPNYNLMLDISSINNPTINVYAVPVAGFAADTVTPIVGQTVTFSDTSSGNPASWAWTFGDGTTSTLQNPTHAYTATGTYTVTLTATNPAGFNTVTKTGYITVTSQPVPVAAFNSGDPTGLAPVTASFTDASTNTPTSWLWESRIADNGAWTTFSTAQNPSGIIFATPGTYDIRLTATNGGGSNTVTKTHVFSAGTTHDYLTTVSMGDINGDVYVNTVSPFTASATQTFTLPAAAVGHVQWAQLYVDTYSGNYNRTYGMTSVVTLDGTTLGTETLNVGGVGMTATGTAYPVNDHVVKVASDYEAVYDVTSRITSASPVVTVTDSTLSGYSFDGRIKGITLVVAYNDGDSDHVRYIVNHGADWMGPAGTTSSTTFDASAIPAGWTSATMTTLAHSSTDGTYKLNGAAITPTSLLTSTYTKFDQFNLTSSLTPAASNTVGFTAVGSSLKMTTAILKARYVTPPTAAFTISPTGTVALGQTVTFTSTSTIPATSGSTTYLWDFGDSATSTLQNPTHAYTTAGTKTVTLVVTNEGGSSTATHTVVVSSQPIISFVPVSHTILPSETTTYVIQMDNAPNGLAGYDLYVSLDNAAVADITGVTYDSSWAQMTMNPTVPADSIHIGAVDTNQKIYPGSTGPFTLATITVRGSAAGTSNIVLSALKMDDDSGNAITATLNPGTVTVSSSTAPVAAFHGTPTSGASPLTVTFTDDSTSSYGAITNWAWDFGDGTISTVQNPPAHTYSVGIYTVKLTVTAPGGTATETKTNYIVSGDAAPVADFTAIPTSGLYPMTVHFTDASAGNVTTYDWNFGDGSHSALQSPAHTYTYPGTFTVSLTVTGPGGSNTKTMTGLINTNVATPTADFSASPTSGLGPLHVSFTDQSTGNLTGITYAWTFGDGATATTQNPDHIYTTNGQYTVTLAIHTANGDNTRTRTNFITVGGNMTVAFTGAPTSGVASRKVPLYVAFTDATSGSPTAWTWDFGNSNTTGSTLQNPTTTYWGRPAKYSVTLTAHSSTDSGAATRTAYINVTPYLEKFPIYDSTHTITGYMTNLPRDLNGDYVYEDINGNGRVDYNDVVTFYNAILGSDYWVQDVSKADIENYDFNGNGAIDYSDVVALNDQVIYT